MLRLVPAVLSSAGLATALLLGATSGAAAATPDVHDCFTGTCTVTVSGPLDIPLDGRAGARLLSVGVDAWSVVLRILGGPNSGSIAMTSAGGTVRFGSDTARITVHVRSLENGTATLDIATTVAAPSPT